MLSIEEEYIRGADKQAMHDVMISDRCAILDRSQCFHVVLVRVEEQVSLEFSDLKACALVVINRSGYL